MPDRSDAPVRSALAGARPALVALRLAGLVGVDVAVGALLRGQANDADIGLGLVLLAVSAGVASCWAVADGQRDRGGPDAERGLLEWVLVGALAGVLAAVGVSAVGAASGGGFAPQALVADLIVLTPVVGALIATPAAAAYALASRTPQAR